jgi:uncharacterized protein
MKFQPDRIDGLAVSAYDPSWLAVNGVRYNHSLLINASGLVQAWPCNYFADIQTAHLDLIPSHEAEIVLLGCGKKQIFPGATLSSAFLAKGMGLESMSTAAACRTFNILASEGRKVAAILLLEVP